MRQLVAGQTAEGGRGSRSVSPAQAQRATTPEWKRKVRAGLRAEAEVAADLAVNGLRAGDTRGIAALAQARSLGLALGGNDPAHKYVVQLTRTPASSELPPSTAGASVLLHGSWRGLSETRPYCGLACRRVMSTANSE